MNFVSIIRQVQQRASVKTSGGSVIPARIIPKSSTPAPSPVRVRGVLARLPVIPIQPLSGTEDVTSIIQNQRANLTLADMVQNLLGRLFK